MPGVDKECEGPGATHYAGCACREAYLRRMEKALRRITWQEQMRGYPTESEWDALVATVREALGEE